MAEDDMSATPQLVSIGDEGVLNTQMAPSLSDIWIDRDLSWLDFNQRVLAVVAARRRPIFSTDTCQIDPTEYVAVLPEVGGQADERVSVSPLGGILRSLDRLHQPRREQTLWGQK
jgi:hypothetical protein